MQKTLATLWIGERLSFIEELCLKSMIAMGHEATLFTYQNVANVPDGVEVRDAREIWDADRLILQQRTGSPAPHADIFRLALLLTGGYVWIDADMLMVQPLDLAQPYMFGYESDTSIGNSILALPQDSEALHIALSRIDEFLATREVETTVPNAFETGLEGRTYEMHIATLGPHLINPALEETGESEHAANVDVFFPNPIGNAGLAMKRPMLLRKKTTPQTIGIHLWSSRLKAALNKRNEDGHNLDALRSSFIGHECDKYDVDITNFPMDLPNLASKPENLAAS